MQGRITGVELEASLSSLPLSPFSHANNLITTTKNIGNNRE